MAAVAERIDSIDDVRALLDSYFEAVQASDLDRILSHYTSDIVAYDAIAQLEFVGQEAYKAHWKVCLDMGQGFTFQPRAPSVAVSGDVAFAHCLINCSGTGPDGEEQSGWMRASFGIRRMDGGWRIAHEHYSAPFDPTTMKILADLEPQ